MRVGKREGQVREELRRGRGVISFHKRNAVGKLGTASLMRNLFIYI
jgi:hypothetical protein